MENIEDFYANSGALIFCNGTKADGTEFYAYVLMKLPNYEKYQAAVDNKESYRLEDFGNIIQQGNTLNPPDSVKLNMSLLYGFNQQFEKKLEDFFGGDEE